MSILGKSRPDNVYQMRTINHARNSEIEIKITVVGESSVGKSSLSNRIAHDKFKIDTESTIGAAFWTFRCTEDGTSYAFKMWDTAGQERFDALVPMYLKGSHIVLMVFDITNLRSFEKIKEKWYKRAREQAPNSTILLLGNKADLDNKQVLSQNINKFIEKTGIKYIECSAKDGEGMDILAKMFLEIVALLKPKTPDSVKLEQKSDQAGGCFDNIRCYPF